ncbi:MAG: transcription factor [Thermoplasmatota archaeon]
MSSSATDPIVKRYIEETVGENGLRIAEALMSRKEATDTELAKELNARPSHIRKVLYTLYEARIAEYHKQKDKETGWLTFFWQISPDHAKAAVQNKIKTEVSKLEQRLVYEQEHEFFACPVGNERFDFADATQHDFQCPDHGAVMEKQDNASEIEEIAARIARLRDGAAS